MYEQKKIETNTAKYLNMLEWKENSANGQKNSHKHRNETKKFLKYLFFFFFYRIVLFLLLVSLTACTIHNIIINQQQRHIFHFFLQISTIQKVCVIKFFVFCAVEFFFFISFSFRSKILIVYSFVGIFVVVVINGVRANVDLESVSAKPRHSVFFFYSSERV